jgi:hypothetical protein
LLQSPKISRRSNHPLTPGKNKNEAIKPPKCGLTDFKQLCLSDGKFIDKTKFILDILNTNQTYILIARPRRWGKSLNLTMAYYFFLK